jgi:putative transposase
MDMLKAYKHRLYPTDDQRQSLVRQFGCSRFAWNWALESRNKAYAETGKAPSAITLTNRLPDLKAEHEWLKEAYSQSLQASIRNLDVAFTHFFRRFKEGDKEKGYPRFKSRHGRQSMQFPQGAKPDFDKGLTILPKMDGIRTVFERRFGGQVKTVTVSMEPTGKFFVSFLVEDGKALPKKGPIDPSKAIGIDLGLTHFLTTSDGEKVENPRFLRKDHKRIRKLSRRVSRKTKGGRNRDKARKRLALVHEKARNRRRDFLHKLSTRLIRENQAVCVEDLFVKGMLGNRRLTRSVSDVAWGEFVGMLKYKSEWQGKHLLEIGRFDPSSRMCSSCGAINSGLTLKDRFWECPSCHAKHDRDWNAARNVRTFALTRRNLIGKVPADCRELTPAEIVR